MVLEYNFKFEIGDRFKASERAGEKGYDGLNLKDIYIVKKIQDKWDDGNIIYECMNPTTEKIFITRTEYMVKIENKYGCKFDCKCEGRCAFFEGV